MNSFEKFGIKHLSPSSLNKWSSSPGWWVDHYLTGNKEPANAAMARGKAIEEGLRVWLQTRDLKMAFMAAKTNYHAEYTGERDFPEEDLIEPSVRQLAMWGAPSSLNNWQVKIEHWFDNIPVPIIGYVDFAFDGIDVDCKSTKACPSEPRWDHVKQVSLYRAARGRRGGIIYVTGKKHAFYEVTDDMRDSALHLMHESALHLSHFLSLCSTVDDAVKSMPLDWSSIYAPKKKDIAA